MNRFIAFVRKEFYHILRDHRTLLILFGMPILQLLLFGFAIRNEIREIKIAVVDMAGDHVSRGLIERLGASAYFSIVEQTGHARNLEDAFQAGRITEAVVLEPEFGRKLQRDGVAAVQIITDATDPNTARMMQAYAEAVIRQYERELFGFAGAAVIIPEFQMRFNPSLESVYLFVPGLMAFILMLVSALMTSITIAREKETGTMEVLLVSPLRPAQIVIGKLVPYIVLAFANVLTVLLLARLVFGVPVQGSVSLLLFESLLFIIVGLAFGVLISSRADTQQTAMMASLAGLLLPTLILSGFIFPISSLPVPLQWVSHIVPAKWFLIIVKGIMLKGVGIGYLWMETSILAAMALLLTVAGVRSLNVRLG